MKKSFLILLVSTSLPLSLLAAGSRDNPSGFGGNPNATPTGNAGNPDARGGFSGDGSSSKPKNDLPLDGGLSILLIAGAGYGIKRYADTKKNNNALLINK